MLARIALAVALIAALVVAALYLGATGRRAGGARRDEAAAREERDDRVDLAGAPDAPDPERVARPVRERAPSAASASTVPAEPATEIRPVLRGVLVHSSDHRPAAGNVLAFSAAEETLIEVVTDEQGRFRIDSPLPPGAVRVWQRGSLSDPEERLEIEPEIFLPELGAGGEPAEVQLVLVDPPTWLEVEVVTVDGVPSAAEVAWNFRPLEGSGLPRDGGALETGAGGRARLPYPSVAPGARLFLIAWLRDATLVSDVVLVEPPLPDAPVRLILDAGGSIRARALHADGEPASFADIDLELEDRTLRLGSNRDRTDRAGFATFLGVAPGRYRLSTQDAKTSEWLSAKAEVERLRTTEVELRASDVPLAVAGRVVDANGNPEDGVSILVDVGDSTTSTRSNWNGSFSVGSESRGPVRVRVEYGARTDRYEPEVLEVPFGTRDILFRCREERPETRLSFEILDRRTLRRIPDVMVLHFVDSQSRYGWAFSRAPEGLASLDLKLYDDVRFLIGAVGYRRREVRAVELVRAPGDGELPRVLLDPGLQRSLAILDEESEAPLAGARVFDGSRLVATSDSAGLAAIDLPEWPVELRVEAPGHANATWDCQDWIGELGAGTVRLERVTEETTGAGR